MRIRTNVVVALLVFSFLWSATAIADERHIVDPAAMRQALADQAATDAQNRGAVLDVLHSSQAREIAERLGLTVAGAESAVSALDSAELDQLAGTARLAGSQLAGGDRMILISTTTALLILIIVILVVR